MSEAVVVPSNIIGTEQQARERAPLAGISLMSFAALLLELGLTRLFSVVLFYHFAFLAISIALLGLGAGGVFAYLRQERLAPRKTRALGAQISAINALATLAVLEIVLQVPVSLELTERNFLKLTALYMSCAIPFFFTGLLFSVVFARETRRIPLLYGADLAGGALACLAIVPLLNWLGGPNTVLVAGVAMALASAVWARTTGARKVALAAAVVLAALIGANHSGRIIDVIYAKGVRLDRLVKVEFVHWNVISRVEVDQKTDHSKWIVIDADANSAVVNVDAHAWEGTIWQKNLMSAPPSVVNVLRPRGNYAIIGPGGGVDVLRAVANGSPHVLGIEINPIIANTIMRGRYASYAYHLYEIPEVRIHVSDGRSFIRNSRQRFDVVQMTLVDTWASTAAGAFALSENNLYTVEAFREYFDHLKVDGLIAITRWEFKEPREALRVVSVAMDALHGLSVADPAAHFLIFSDGPLDEDGRAVVVLAKKSPFTSEEEATVRAHLAANPSLVAQYMPSARGANPFSALIARNDPWAFARGYEYNVAPVNDNAPFFFFTLKTRQVLNESALHHGMDWKVNLGVAVLGMVLVISIAAVSLFLILPLLVHRRRRHEHAVRLLYFVAVGLGYILVEIAFIQRFVLFLGHPTYALTVVVFLLLLSSGAGSLASRRCLSEPLRVRLPLALIVAALLLHVVLLPRLLTQLVGIAFGLKLLVSGTLLIPLGFAMGMPFPTGLRALAGTPLPVPLIRSGPDWTSDRKQNAVEWAWAMNAASSVLGSVAAMVIAIHFGLNVTLACGAFAYLLAMTLSGRLQRQTGSADL